MGGDYFYCPHCQHAIPYDDIRKKLDLKYELENIIIQELMNEIILKRKMKYS